MKEKKERRTKHAGRNTKLKPVITHKGELLKSGKPSLDSRIFLTESQLPLTASAFFFSLKKLLWRRGCQGMTIETVTPTQVKSASSSPNQFPETLPHHSPRTPPPRLPTQRKVSDVSGTDNSSPPSVAFNDKQFPASARQP